MKAEFFNQFGNHFNLSFEIDHLRLLLDILLVYQSNYQGLKLYLDQLYYSGFYNHLNYIFQYIVLDKTDFFVNPLRVYYPKMLN